jgi:hypothetical protein
LIIIHPIFRFITHATFFFSGGEDVIRTCITCHAVTLYRPLRAPLFSFHSPFHLYCMYIYIFCTSYILYSDL